jgi:hypothetical protein
MKRLITFVVALLALPASATDTPPNLVNKQQGCQVYTMCGAQTATGACTLGATGLKIVADTIGKYLFSAYANQSTASTFSCDFKSSDTDSSGTAWTITGTSPPTLTNSQLMSSFEGQFYNLWVNCSSISGGGAAVTITLLACPLRTP